MTAAVNVASLGTAVNADSSGNFQMNSGYGSVATAYGCRAWVNFNGTGTVAIRASGNVSGITDNAVGDYVINFTTALPDANYASIPQAHNPGVNSALANIVSKTTASARLVTYTDAGSVQDCSVVDAAFFR